jgi:hypothetical protein
VASLTDSAAAALKASNQRVFLEFQLQDHLVQVPFTDLELAETWGRHLQQDWQQLELGDLTSQ